MRAWMKFRVYTERGDIFLGELEAEPECGEDFCDTCGDCLYCYGDEDCVHNAGHGHAAIKYMTPEAYTKAMETAS